MKERRTDRAERTRTRRSLLAAVPALALTSGCLDALGEDGLTFEAAPAETTPADGYEFAGVEEQTVTRTYAGQDVEAVNKVTTYEKTLSIPLLGEANLGVFALLSTPAIEIAGKTFNPVADYSNDRLVELLTDNYEGIDDPRRVGGRTVTVLGSETDVTEYEATAEFDGQDVDVTIHLTKVRDGEDFVVPMGIYPRRTDEEDNVLSMMRATDHSG